MNSMLGFFVAREWEGSTFRELVTKIPLLVCSVDPSTRSTIEEELAERDIAPCGIINSAFPSMQLELCQSGVGIGLFSEETIKRFNRGTIRSLSMPREAPRLQERYFVTWAAKSERTEGVQRLKELLG
jgi:DNA-binding transcriptional LysR family regulator